MIVIHEKEYLPVLKANFKVCAYHIDRNSRLRPNFLTAFIQEAAWQHASHLDLGIEYMNRTGLAWMLIRMYLEMEEFPVWHDEVTVETWPKGTDGLFFIRDMVVYNNNKRIGAATTYWMLVDIKTKRPKIPELHTNILSLNKDRHALQKKPGKLKLQSGIIKDKITARISDIDINNHVNSNRYIEWVINNLTSEVLEDITIRSFQINYLNEVKLGDEILLNTGTSGQNGEIIFEGIKTKDSKTCFQAAVTLG